LEAALIIGIVLGALSKIRRQDLAPAAWFGTFAAVAVSILAAILLTSFGLSLEGASEEIFEGITMLIAAGILTWMIFWMGKQARSIKGELEAGVSKAVASAGTLAVFWLAFLAVVREGVELAIFITAAFFASSQSEMGSNVLPILAGTILGLATAAILGWMLFATAMRLNLRRFFQVTGVLLILFAAGLVAHGVHELNEAAIIPAIIDPVWNMNAFLSEDSLLGQLLTALFGYNGNPSLTEALAYISYLVIVSVLWMRSNIIPVKSTASPSQLRA
jgi:high-affinity iron transporter